MEEEDYGHGKYKKISTCIIEMGSEMEEGGMIYQDEDGNLIMYHHDEMGEDDEDEMGGDYGMEGSPGVSK